MSRTSAGALLAVAMGIGRFAYTPLLPAMHAQAGLSYGLAGMLASINLSGYLAGALLTMAPFARRNRRIILIVSLMAIVLATFQMAVPFAAAWWMSRLITGIASGFVFVLTSSVALERSARDPRFGWMPYCGVGLGIAASGLLGPFFVRLGSWQTGWIALACAGALIGIPALMHFDSSEERAEIPAVQPSTSRRSTMAYYGLLLAYGGEGLGYIIPATFMVAIVRSEPSVATFADLSWVIVGIIAVPSLFFWMQIRAVLGPVRTLIAALLVQAAGILASAAFTNAFGAICGAVTLGGTFLGISAIGLGLGRASAPQRAQVRIGALTTVFGIGQIAGPLVASHLMSASGNYTGALYFAAAVLGVSAVSLMALK